MIYCKILIFSLVFAVQPLLAAEKSGLFTVDMAKLLRSSEFGKNIIAANNIARKKLQSENEELGVEGEDEEEVKNQSEKNSTNKFKKQSTMGLTFVIEKNELKNQTYRFVPRERLHAMALVEVFLVGWPRVLVLDGPQFRPLLF